MIPEKFILVARAEYLCHVTELISLGEAKELTPRVTSSIKLQSETLL